MPVIYELREQLRRGRSIYELPLRVTFYARVSTEKLEQQSSLDNQVQYYTDLIARTPRWEFVSGYVDEGVSGTSTGRREQFLRMIADAHGGRFDLILTKEISRFSRSTLDSIRYTQELLAAGVGVLFETDGINTLDSDSEFRLVVMAGVAQDEVRKLSERLKFGFRQSIRNGRVLGNSNLWGYQKHHGRLEVDPVQAEAVRLIFELYATGEYGVRRLAQELTRRGYTSALGNAFNATTIRNILVNPKYKGWYCGNKSRSLDYRTGKTLRLTPDQWVMHPDETVPALVSEELWERANALYRARSAAARTAGKIRPAGSYPYSGKIICGRHGSAFHRQAFATAEGQTECWRCQVYRAKGKAGCDLPGIKTTQLDAVLAQVFAQVVESKKALIQLVCQCIQEAVRQQDRSSCQLARLQQQMEQVRGKKEKLLELCVAGAVDAQEFSQRNEAYNEQLQQLQQTVDALHSRQMPAADRRKLEQALWQEMTFDTGVHSAVVAAILDHAVVESDSTQQQVALRLFLTSGQTALVRFYRSPFSVCDISFS